MNANPTNVFGRGEDFITDQDSGFDFPVLFYMSIFILLLVYVMKRWPCSFLERHRIFLYLHALYSNALQLMSTFQQSSCSVKLSLSALALSGYYLVFYIVLPLIMDFVIQCIKDYWPVLVAFCLWFLWYIANTVEDGYLTKRTHKRNRRQGNRPDSYSKYQSMMNYSQDQRTARYCQRANPTYGKRKNRDYNGHCDDEFEYQYQSVHNKSKTSKNFYSKRKNSADDRCRDNEYEHCRAHNKRDFVIFVVIIFFIIMYI